MNFTKTLPGARAAFLAASLAPGVQAAVDSTFRFDAISSGAPANLASSQGITFAPAVWAPILDGDGIAVPGSEAWRSDATAGPVTVDNPATFGRGPAPSPNQALNAVFQPVLIQFAAPEVLRRFAVTLDRDPLGDVSASIGFYSADDRLLSSLPIDQTRPGLVVEAALELSGVSSIVLPAGAFYDDLAVSSVPEPGPVWLLGLGALALGVCRPRRGFIPG